MSHASYLLAVRPLARESSSHTYHHELNCIQTQVSEAYLALFVCYEVQQVGENWHFTSIIDI